MNAVLASCLAVTMLLFYVLFTALQPVSLSVNRRTGFAPMTVRAEVRIPRHDANRKACVFLDAGGEHVGGSCWDLDLGSPTVFQRTWTIGGGEYIAHAALQRELHVLRSNRVQLTVIEE